MKEFSLTERERKLILDALDNQVKRALDYGIFSDKEIEEFCELRKKLGGKGRWGVSGG